MDAGLRARLKDLEIRALKIVNQRFMGEWASNVRGQGLDFLDLREYVVGDDVRRLDWKATARSGRPQLRRFVQDRQQVIWLALDLSASMEGDKTRTGRELMALMAWAAVKQGDRFGMAGFTDRVEIHRNPARGEAQLWAGLEDILSQPGRSPKTDPSALWQFFLEGPRHSCTLILVSDFYCPLDSPLLGALAQRHEILAFHLRDPREQSREPGGLLPLIDRESGLAAWVDMNGSQAVRQRIQREADHAAWVRKVLKQKGIWYQDFLAGEDYLPGLMAFLHRRSELIHG